MFQVTPACSTCNISETNQKKIVNITFLEQWESISMKLFLNEFPKHVFKLMGKIMVTILHLKASN